MPVRSTIPFFSPMTIPFSLKFQFSDIRQCFPIRFFFPEQERRSAGMTPGIAINPGTSVETVMEMLRIVKKVLVMTVNPGNAGQMYMPYVGKKITKLLALKEDMNSSVPVSFPATPHVQQSVPHQSADACRISLNNGK